MLLPLLWCNSVLLLDSDFFLLCDVIGKKKEFILLFMPGKMQAEGFFVFVFLMGSTFFVVSLKLFAQTGFFPVSALLIFILY